MYLENNIDVNKSVIGYNKRFNRRLNLYKGVITLFETRVCNCHLEKKYKIKFIQQFFNWFYRSPNTFNMEPVLKYGIKGKIVESDYIYINATAKFAFIKKLFSILNLKIIDEKKIKKRRYAVLFTLYFSDLRKYENEILLDINSNSLGVVEVFMIVNSYYLKDIMQLIFFYYKNLLS